MEPLKHLIKQSKRIVIFSGAGYSTESNIPDFRSDKGIYQKTTYPYPAEVMLSHDMFMMYPELFYKFYKNEMIYPDALPNKAHLAAAKLERLGKLEAIITQNIDGLHQKAGNKKVYELHGSVLRNYCMDCGKFYSLEDMMKSEGIPQCTCGGIIKPDVVLYQEGLDYDVMENAIQALQNADLLIIAGTSLVVYPAAGLIDYYLGKNLVLINKDKTSADHKAKLVYHDKVGEVLSFILEEDFK